MNPQIKCNSNQNSTTFSCRNGKTDLKIHKEVQGILSSQNILKKNRDLKITHKSMPRYSNQSNVVLVLIDMWISEYLSLEMNPYIYGDLIFGKSPKTIQ